MFLQCTDSSVSRMWKIRVPFTQGVSHQHICHDFGWLAHTPSLRVALLLYLKPGDFWRQ